MSNKVQALKAKVLKAQEKSDLAALYVLQEEAHDLFDEETLSAFFANILDLALENLTDTLESCRKFDANDVQDFATLRALYEYAMEHYHAGAIKDASALFEVLSGITDDEAFCIALKYHHKATEAGISLDRFLDEYADMEQTQFNNTFYISSFREKVQKLLDKSQSKGE